MTSIEEQLAKTQKELEDLKAEYHEYAYIVSHDLHAPFRTIEGFLGIIEKNHADTFDEKTKRNFQLITNGVEEGKDILQSLLEFSRLNTKTEPFLSVDCDSLLSEVEASLGELIDSKKAQITRSNLPVITADKQQITLIFYHLLKNALIYQAEKNRPIIFITAEESPQYWKFCVKDNGIGIPPNLTEKIFKVLRRATGDAYPGRGMGLALVRKVLQRHGGAIWIGTTKGLGSSLHFTISRDLAHD